MKKKQNPHKPGVDWAFFPRYQQRKDPSAKTCRCRAPRGADGLAVASAAGAVAASAGAALDLRPYENFSERIDLETTSKGELCNTPAGVLRRVVASVFSFERNIVLFVCVFSFFGCGEARFVRFVEDRMRLHTVIKSTISRIRKKLKQETNNGYVLKKLKKNAKCSKLCSLYIY